MLQSSIAPYRFGNIYNHEERRKRKLLLHKYEIQKLDSRISQKGLTIVPLSLFFSKGFIKVRLGCCRGKKAHDKRQAIIEREKKRELSAAMQHSYR